MCKKKLKKVISVILALFFCCQLFAQQVTDVMPVGGFGQDNVRSVMVDSENNIYVYGHGERDLRINGSFYPSPFGTRTYAYIVKLDASKNLVWYKSILYRNSDVTGDTRIAIGDDKSVYITDSYFGSVEIDTQIFRPYTGNGQGYITYKLDSLGNHQWAINSGGKTIRYDDSGYLEISNFDAYNDTLNGESITNVDGTIAWLDLDGNYIDHMQYDDPAYSHEVIKGRDRDGNYFGYRRDVGGITATNALELFKVDSSGTLIKANFIQNCSWADSPPTMVCDYENGGYYFINKLYDREPLDGPATHSYSVLKLVKTDENFNVLAVLDLGPRNDLNGGNPAILLNVIDGDVFVTGKILTSFSKIIWSSFGQKNYVYPDHWKLVVAKLSDNLDLKWYREVPVRYYASALYSVMKYKDELLVYGQHKDFRMDSLFCDVHGSMDPFILLINDQDSTNIELRGNVFYDIDQNGVRTAADLPMPYRRVSNNNFSGSWFFSNPNGEYASVGSLGNQTLKSGSLPLYWQRSTPDSIEVFLSSSDTVITDLDFGMLPIPGIVDLSVDIIPLSPARPGFGVNYLYEFCNIGTETISPRLWVVQDHNLNYLSSSMLPDSISGDSLLFIIPQLGANDCVEIIVQDSLNADVGLIGQQIYTWAIGLPTLTDTVPENNIDGLIQEVTGSYDPNDINVTPPCDVSTSFVQNGNYLEYLIRFQNTGTDTAFSVTIKDTLPAVLETSDFEFLASSHEVDISIINQEIILQFKNILLPDSTTNLEKSNGYFKYKIKASPNLVLGDSINNSAAIFFDFNPPILTNTASTLISNDLIRRDKTISICEGDSILIGTNFQSLAGIYIDTFRSIVGCDSILSITLEVNPRPNITLSSFDPDTVCNNGSAVMLPFATPEGGTYTGIGVIGDNFDPAVAGVGRHTVIYTFQDINACVNSDTISITVDACTGINNKLSDIGISIYPNPNTGEFFVEKPVELVEVIEIMLWDARAKLMVEKIMPIEQQRISLDMRNYSAGIYHVQLLVKGKLFTKRIIKN